MSSQMWMSVPKAPHPAPMGVARTCPVVTVAPALLATGGRCRMNPARVSGGMGGQRMNLCHDGVSPWMGSSQWGGRVSPCLGVTMPWGHLAIGLPCYGITVSWGHHAMVPRCNELTMSWGHHAMGSPCHDLPMPWSPYAMRSTCHSLPMPQCHHTTGSPCQYPNLSIPHRH